MGLSVSWLTGVGQCPEIILFCNTPPLHFSFSVVS
mgnify:CR=1 FL=1